jgi:hypothetical protein
MTQHENFARLVSASAERVRYKAGDVILKRVTMVTACSS